MGLCFFMSPKTWTIIKALKARWARNVKMNDLLFRYNIAGGEIMQTNFEMIQEVICYIDCHLKDCLTLDRPSQTFHYSKYHLSRMFANVVGFSIHHYVRRRRLNEAATNGYVHDGNCPPFPDMKPSSCLLSVLSHCLKRALRCIVNGGVIIRCSCRIC